MQHERFRKYLTGYIFLPTSLAVAPLGAPALRCLDSSHSLLMFPSCAFSQTAKLDDLAIHGAASCVYETSNHLDNLSLKRPGNVTPIQTHSSPPPSSPSTHLRSAVSLLLADPAEKTRQINMFFSSCSQRLQEKINYESALLLYWWLNRFRRGGP